MDKLTEKQEQKLRLLEDSLLDLELLEASLGVREEDKYLLDDPEAIKKAEEASRVINLVWCASVKRLEDTQYNFMVLYQTLVVILAVAALIMLLVAAWLLVNNQVIEGLVSGVGTIVTGVGSWFLLKQRSDARDTHIAALAMLEKRNCSE